MPAIDALTAKNILRQDLERNPRMARFMKEMMGSYQRAGGKVYFTSEKLIADLPRWLNMSETYYVAHNMNALITGASESLPDEPLLPEDLPSDNGFVLIPGGLKSIDVRGLVVVANAVQWTVFGRKVLIAMYSDKYDPAVIEADKLQPAYDEEAYDLLPRYTLLHLNEIRFGHALPVSYGPSMLIPPEYGLNVTYTNNGVAITTDKGLSAEEMRETFGFSTRTDPMMKWLVTMWRLMQQPLTVIETEDLSRQQRRAMERQNRPERHVSVITLRRTERRSEGHSEVAWTHAWIRRGHWRKQWYGSGENRVQRVIYIHPALVNGGKGLPLLVRDRVYELKR